MTQKIDLLTFIGDDTHRISYRPRWNEMTGSVTATILLQQIIYRWVHHGRRPFYKFILPCDHPACRPGDSWAEELGFSRYEFEGARKKIATKTKQKLDEETFVSYWVDGQRKTWYALNETVLLKALQKLYPKDDKAPPAGLQQDLGLPDEPDSGPSEPANGADLMVESSVSPSDLTGKTSISPPDLTGKSPVSPHELKGKSPVSPRELKGESSVSPPDLTGKTSVREGGYRGNSTLANGEIPLFLTTEKTTRDGGTAKENVFSKMDAEKTKNLWDAVLHDLCQQMTKATYDTWLVGSNLHFGQQGRAYVVVQNDFAVDWLNGRLQDLLARTLAAHVNADHVPVQAVTRDELDQILAFQANTRSRANTQAAPANAPTGGPA